MLSLARAVDELLPPGRPAFTDPHCGGHKDNHPDLYLIIDGYKRIAELRQLGRDTAEAWPMNDPEGLLLDRSLRLFEHETALEQGWLLAKMERRFG